MSSRTRVNNATYKTNHHKQKEVQKVLGKWDVIGNLSYWNSNSTLYCQRMTFFNAHNTNHFEQSRTLKVPLYEISAISSSMIFLGSWSVPLQSLHHSQWYKSVKIVHEFKSWKIQIFKFNQILSSTFYILLVWIYE